jgi:diacylglycerol kinase (ATP)
VFSKVDSLLAFLIFIMAFIIARSRVKTAIHTTWEVVVGAILGILTTTMVFQILR